MRARSILGWRAAGAGCLLLPSLLLWFYLLVPAVDKVDQGPRLCPSAPRSPARPPNTTNVLILSSVGRSGSSFLGNVVSMIDDSFYFFEPMMTVNKHNGTREETLKEIRKAFQCELRDNLFSTAHGKVSARVSFRSGCTSDMKMTEHIEIARHLCRTLPVRIVKTIRTRLEWITELMEDESLDLRVIHLVRDPRPVKMSQQKLKWRQDYIDNSCNNTRQDFLYKDTMEKLYPGRFLFLRFEDLIMNLPEKTREISKLVGGVRESGGTLWHPPADLPRCLQKFIIEQTSHDSSKRGFKAYQKWRTVITQEELNRTETACRETLTLLGYNIFTTVQAARNLKNPLLSKIKH